ncbi:hypothetical protein QQP08_018934 [Theobroma cacao]|nr:hypothetical protein QQP08_018934 [Theobroma cacao]
MHWPSVDNREWFVLFLSYLCERRIKGIKQLDREKGEYFRIFAFLFDWCLLLWNFPLVRTHVPRLLLKCSVGAIALAMTLLL